MWKQAEPSTTNIPRSGSRYLPHLTISRQAPVSSRVTTNTVLTDTMRTAASSPINITTNNRGLMHPPRYFLKEVRCHMHKYVLKIEGAICTIIRSFIWKLYRMFFTVTCLKFCLGTTITKGKARIFTNLFVQEGPTQLRD